VALRGQKEISRRSLCGKLAEGDLSEISIVEAIRKTASFRATASSDSLESLELFLRSWWSKAYNRPLKDPILESYHVYELMYEYFDKIERQNAANQALEQETDKIEDDKIQETLDWVMEEERKAG
jgi:hypothetical protein